VTSAGSPKRKRGFFEKQTGQSKGESNQSEGSNGETHMFEAVISAVKTGRVQRQLFATRDEAERFLAVTEDRLVNPPKKWNAKTQTWQEQKPRSMRNYRMEIVYRDCPAVVRATERVTTRRRVAA
jgi:hypothetical protein